MLGRLRSTTAWTAALLLASVTMASADESMEVQAAVDEAVAEMEKHAEAAAAVQPSAQTAAPMERYELSPTEGNPMEEGWSYDSGYIFGLTRGLSEAGCEGSCRPWVVPWTAVTDVVTLPGAALAGLFG